MENPILDELSFQIFEKTKKSKNRDIQKVVFAFFEKSMPSLKILIIVLRSFPMLNDQNQSDSVFFGKVR